jgi:hypothetical protein
VTHPLLQESTSTRKEGTWKRFAQSSLQEGTTIRKEERKGNRDKREDISYFLIYEKRDYIKQCSFSFGPTF